MNQEQQKKINLDIRNGEELSSLGLDIEPEDYYGFEKNGLDEEYDYNAWMYEEDDYIPPQPPTKEEQEKNKQALNLLSRIKGDQTNLEEDWPF